MKKNNCSHAKIQDCRLQPHSTTFFPCDLCRSASLPSVYCLSFNLHFLSRHPHQIPLYKKIVLLSKKKLVDHFWWNKKNTPTFIFLFVGKNERHEDDDLFLNIIFFSKIFIPPKHRTTRQIFYRSFSYCTSFLLALPSCSTILQNVNQPHGC